MKTENSELRNVIIAFLTARRRLFAVAWGLNAGADDACRKPIKPKLLVSR
jgi:DNA-binding response OmpR family regulator